MQTEDPTHAAARTRTADEDAAIRGVAWSRYGYLPHPDKGGPRRPPARLLPHGRHAPAAPAGEAMTRADALTAATSFVDGIAPRQNARGYSDGCLTASQRIAEILRVAEWLLAEHDPIEVRDWAGTVVREVER